MFGLDPCTRTSLSLELCGWFVLDLVGSAEEFLW